MKKLKNLEETLQYHELLMTRELDNFDNYFLPKGYSFVFWDNDDCIYDWINIHLETGEFNSIDDAYAIFHQFYDSFYDQLSSRCLFIKNSEGEKIATATVSPANEFGFSCVIDWFAVSPQAQGMKLSKPLLSKILYVAKGLGYKNILLHTQTNTWLAAKIYLDCGFKPLIKDSTKGWEILKTITNHEKLKEFKKLRKNEIYDKLFVKIKKELDKLHKNYKFSIYYINNRNDVYVREGDNFFEYKYRISGDKLILEEQRRYNMDTFKRNKT